MAKSSRIHIPILIEPCCRFIQVCGAIKTDDPTLLQEFDKFDKMNALSAKFGPENDEHYALLFGGSTTKRGRHIHLNVARKSYFQEPPTAESKIAELEKIVNEFADQEMSASVVARYRIPLKEVAKDSLIRTMMFPELVEKDFAVKQNGASFSIRNGPFNQVQWRITNGGIVQIEFQASVKRRLNKNFYGGIYGLMDTSFRSTSKNL